MSTVEACQECGTAVPGDAPEGLCPSCLMKNGFQAGRDSPVKPAPTSTTGYAVAFTAPEPAELAQHFPQLEVLELLGQGGMGAVYKARQLKLDRPVALKILPLGAGSDPAFAERFTREARALARLSHPHIVAVHDFGETGGLYYFIMEYVDGANLRQLLWGRQLKPEDSLKIIPQVCEALQYAHEEGIVHRDIKPENILLDKKGRVKIADFGLAKLLGNTPVNYTLTGSRQMVGTPHYMAPEQMERPLEVDHRADIFSLGVVFYEMLTSELPLGRFAPPSYKARTDKRLDDVVLRALTKEPDQRYQRVSDIKAEVEAIARAEPAAVPVATLAALDPADTDLELVRPVVQGPAGGLMLTGILAIMSWIALVSLIPVRTYYDHGRPVYESLGSIYPGLIPLFLVPGLILFLVPFWMVRFRRYDFAMMAGALALAPWSPAWPLGLVVGIWTLRVLHRRDVKHAFGLTSRPAGSGPPGRPPSPDSFDLDMTRMLVQGPAGGLIMTGLLALLSWSAVVGLVPIPYQTRAWYASPQYGYSIVTAYRPLGDAYPGLIPLFLFPGAVLLLGALLMARLRRYEMATVASILAIVPWSPAWPLGIVTGIWALAVLRRPDVKAAFALTANPRSRAREWTDAAESPPPPTDGPPRGKFKSMVRALRYYCIDSLTGSRSGD